MWFSKYVVIKNVLYSKLNTVHQDCSNKTAHKHQFPTCKAVGKIEKKNQLDAKMLCKFYELSLSDWIDLNF